MKQLSTKSKLINRGFNTYFSAVFLSSLLWTLSSVLDSAIAGVLFSLDALTGVGIAVIFDTFAWFLYTSFVSGSTFCIGNELGKGNNRQANIIFSQNMFLTGMMSLVLCITAFFFADKLVFIMGAHDPKIALPATRYLRVLAFSYLFYPFTEMVYNSMLLYGYKREINFEIIIELVTNLGASLFYVKVFHMGVDGLALGTITSYLFETIYLIFVCILKPRGISFIPNCLHNFISNEWNVIKKGLPSCINSFSDFILSIIMTNIISLTLGTACLTIFTLFSSLHSLARNVPYASGICISSFSSVFYGSRDVLSLKKIQKNSIGVPFASAIAFSIVMLIFNNQILMFFGADSSTMIHAMFGAFLWLIPTQLLQTIQYNFVSYYSATEHSILSCLFSIVGDFVLYIPITLLLMKPFGISAIWISYPICFIIFYCIMVWYYQFAHKRNPSAKETDSFMDKYMLLPDDYRNDTNLLTFSLSSEKDSSLSMMEEIQAFLVEQGFEISICLHCTLCLEELATRILINRPKHFDIRIFVSKGKLRFSIIDDSPANNHLIFEPKDMADGAGILIVRKMAETVEYNYMVGLNVLNVTV